MTHLITIKPTKFFRPVALGVFLALFSWTTVLSHGNGISSFKIKKSKRKSVTIPFKMVNNLMIIPTSINGSDTLNLILDTGVNKTLVTSLRYHGGLTLQDYKTTKLAGLGGGDPITAYVSKGNEISLGGALGTNQEVYVLTEDIFQLSTSLGMKVHGLIGFSVFKDFVVEINYESKRLTLHDPERFHYKGKGERLTISIEKTKPYVEAVALQENGDRVKVKMMVDTGASHAVSLYDYDKKGIEVPEKSFRSFLGRGLNGNIHGSVARLDKFWLGPYKLPEPVVNYPDSIDIAIAMQLSDRSGSIGSELLRRFRVIFDYPNRQMILTKGRFYKDEFDYNRSGVDVVAPFPGVNYYSVSHIRIDSPSAKAGLMYGDELVSVNGRFAKNMKMNELTSLLHGHKNRKMKLEVMRDGKLKRINFMLNEEI